MMALNLLHYPALARQRRTIHRQWTFLAGGAAGALVAVWLWTGVQEKQRQQAQERAALEARLQQAQHRLAADKARQAQHHTWLQQDAHVQALATQQRRWEALHQALLQEAGPDTVQLLRLQLDAQTLELHGQAMDVQRMTQARTRLSRPLAEPVHDSAWTLVSLAKTSGTDGAASPLEFVWQAPWPALVAGPVATAPARDKTAAASGQVLP